MSRIRGCTRQHDAGRESERGLAGDFECHPTIRPSGDHAGRDGSTSDREDDEQDDEDSCGAVLTAAALALAGEGVDHVVQEAGGMAGRLPDVVGLGVGVPTGDREAAEAAVAVGVRQAVGPDPEAAPEHRQDDDEVAELEHHLALLRGQVLGSHGSHGQEREIHPGEAAGGHHEPTPGDEARPSADDLAFGQIGAAGVGIPEADPEVQDQEQQQPQWIHRVLSLVEVSEDGNPLINCITGFHVFVNVC